MPEMPTLPHCLNKQRLFSNGSLAARTVATNAARRWIVHRTMRAGSSSARNAADLARNTSDPPHVGPRWPRKVKRNMEEKLLRLFTDDQIDLVIKMSLGAELIHKYPAPPVPATWWLRAESETQLPDQIFTKAVRHHLIRSYPSDERYVLKYTLRGTKYVREIIAKRRTEMVRAFNNWRPRRTPEVTHEQ
jgi:hypothetical protein